jgi:hypothetical protein
MAQILLQAFFYLNSSYSRRSIILVNGAFHS